MNNTVQISTLNESAIPFGLVRLANQARQYQTGQTITIKEFTITPDLAEEWLKKNIDNRPLKRSKLRTYKKSLENGDFKYTTDTIKFDEDGILLDGQHRLGAIVESGRNLVSDIALFVPRATFSFIDIGANRSGSDVVAMAGYNYYTQTAAAVKLIISLSRNTPGTGINYIGVSNQDILDYLEENPVAHDIIVRYCGSYNDSDKLISKRNLTGLAVIFHQKDSEKAELFLNKLMYGLDLNDEHPVFYLRKSLMKYKDPRKSTKLTAIAEVAFIIKAWNDFRRGKFRKFFKFKVTDKFPEII